MTRRSRTVEVKVLRGECADDETCPTISDVGDPEALYFIGEPHSGGRFRLPEAFVPEVPAVDGWAYLAGTQSDHNDIYDAHRARIGEGERLYRVELNDIPPALRKAVISR